MRSGSLSRDHYGGVGVFGWVQTIVGVGSIAGSVAAFAWRPRRPLWTGLVLTLGWPLLNGAFALGAPIPVVVVLALVGGFGFSLCLIWWETALAHQIPPNALSRVSAYDWMGSLALLPLGYVVAGPLANAFGARTVLGVGSAIGVALLVLALLPRSTRELPGPPDVELAVAQPRSRRAMSA